MNGSRRWWAPLVAGSVLLAVLFAAVPAPAQERGRDCSLSSVGLVPLTDLGSELYRGEQGGLYPGGVNEPPADHVRVGLMRASMIEPLDAAGKASPDGKIVFASVGFSNPQREFIEFQRMVPSVDNLDADVVVVNGAQGGEHILAWSDPRGRPWQGLETELSQAGVTAEQVQGLWVKMTQRAGVSPDLPFPDNARTYEAELEKVVLLLQERLPNLQVAYVSSRAYGGYGGETSPSPEPVAYEEGFGVKWLIQRQLEGDPAINPDPAAGPLEAPWLAWGPYLWADGANPRSDGLTWSCSDYRSDGAHFVASGNQKVATMLLDFLQGEPTAAWLFSDRELPEPPETSAPAATTTTVAAAEPTTTTAQSPETRPPATTTTIGAGVDTPAQAEPTEDGLPVAVWVALGAGAGMLMAAGVFQVISRRRSGDQP